MSIKIVFIGAGHMASAMVSGLLKKESYTPGEIACTCGSGDTGRQLAEDTGIQYLPEITSALEETDVVVLACKPQQLPSLPKALFQATNKLVLSILAGTPLSLLSEKFNQARNLVRAMPNMPGQIGAGVTAFSSLRKLTSADTATVESTLESLGNFHEVEEPDLDAITALSGSGPAYVFEFAEALRQAGIHCGLDEELSTSITIDTLLGAAMLLATKDATPEQLRDAVTSQGGTTEAALKVLSDSGFRDLIDQTLAAARSRSIELAQE